MSTEQIVFVVDDDEAMRGALTAVLQTQGYVVQTFASAQSFIDVHDSVGSGCLLLDVNMPEMNGLELQERLVKMKSSLPIIFMTGDGQTPESDRALKAGALAFLRKPFDFGVLVEFIDKAMAIMSDLTPGQAGRGSNSPSAEPS